MSVFDGFKTAAMEHVSRSPALRAAVPRAALPKMPGLKVAEEFETMTKKKWKQTAKDLPVAVLASGVGYGVGRVGAELIGKKLQSSGLNNPTWLKGMPIATAALGGLGSLATARTRSILRQRREEAEK